MWWRIRSIVGNCLRTAVSVQYSDKFVFILACLLKVNMNLYFTMATGSTVLRKNRGGVGY